MIGRSGVMRTTPESEHAPPTIFPAVNGMREKRTV